MNDIELDHKFFIELSAFLADARKEGFSFRPSRIVKDKNYCSDVLAILAGKGSEALNVSAIRIIGKRGNLSIDHEITKPWDIRSLSVNSVFPNAVISESSW